MDIQENIPYSLLSIYTIVQTMVSIFHIQKFPVVGTLETTPKATGKFRQKASLLFEIQ